MKCVYLLGIVLFLFSTVCSAQNKQVGFSGGFCFFHDSTVTAPSGEARAGFGPRFSAGGGGGERFEDRFGGEFRYTFQDGDSELRSGTLEANLDAPSHSLLGDFLIYGRSRGPKLQPYGAVGFGVKIYQATEPPTAGRPLMNFATLINSTDSPPPPPIRGGTPFDNTVPVGVSLCF